MDRLWVFHKIYAEFGCWFVAPNVNISNVNNRCQTQLTLLVISCKGRQNCITHITPYGPELSLLKKLLEVVYKPPAVANSCYRLSSLSDNLNGTPKEDQSRWSSSFNFRFLFDLKMYMIVGFFVVVTLKVIQSRYPSVAFCPGDPKWDKSHWFISFEPEDTGILDLFAYM